MFWRLTLFFILFPTIELLVLLFFSSSPFGFLLVLTSIGLTAVLGAWLLSRQGRRCWQELDQRLDRGETTTSTLLHACLLMVSGALLITPGLVSDLFGLLLLVPPVRSLIIAHLLLRFEAQRGRSRQHGSPKAPDDVIDV